MRDTDQTFQGNDMKSIKSVKEEDTSKEIFLRPRTHQMEINNSTNNQMSFLKTHNFFGGNLDNQNGQHDLNKFEIG